MKASCVYHGVAGIDADESIPMKITLVRSGRAAGMRLEATIDTSVLEADTASDFHRLVQSADLAQLSDPTIPIKSEPDRFRYTLTVEDGGRQSSTMFDEQHIPEPVRPLIEAVWRSTGSGPVMRPSTRGRRGRP